MGGRRRIGSEYRTEPDPNRERMSVRLSPAEARAIAAIQVQGNHSLSKAVREILAAGINALAERNRGAEA